MLDFVWSGFHNTSNISKNAPRTIPTPNAPRVNLAPRVNPAPIEYSYAHPPAYQNFSHNFQAKRCYEHQSIADNFLNGNLFFPTKVVHPKVVHLSDDELSRRSNQYSNNTTYIFSV